MEQQNQCKNCKRFLSNDNFYKDNKRKNGLMSKCKSCVSEYKKDWRIKNPDKQKRIWLRSYFKTNNIEPPTLHYKDGRIPQEVLKSIIVN